MKNKVKIKEEAEFPLSLFDGYEKYKNLPQILNANTIVSLILKYEGERKFIDLISKYISRAKKDKLLKNGIFLETWPTNEFNGYFDGEAITKI